MSDLWIAVNKGGTVAVVIDSEDLELLDGFGCLWLNVTSGGSCRSTKRYVMAEKTTAGRRRRIYLHRLLCGLEPGDRREVDHKDGDPLNNRRSNLRVGTHQENMAAHVRRHPIDRRRRASRRSRFRSVYWIDREQRWRVVVVSNKVQHRLGSFVDEDEAGRVAMEGRARLTPFAPVT